MSAIPIGDIQAIDVHAHYGRYEQAGDALKSRLMSGTPAVVLDRARRAATPNGCSVNDRRNLDLLRRRP